MDKERTRNSNEVDRATSGPVSILIYRNTGQNGPFHTGTIFRRYWHKKMGESVTTNNGYTSHGLEHLIKAAVEAKNKIDMHDDIARLQGGCHSERTHEQAENDDVPLALDCRDPGRDRSAA